MPLQATSGAASYDGFGGGVPVVPAYIEEVFSTYLYTGSGTSKTITNNIDLSTKGGLVWTKMRSSPVSNQHDHKLSDSVTGVNQALQSNNTNPIGSSASFGITAFNTDGYTITNPSGDGSWNYTNDTFVSWTFRKQPKFFDVVTFTAGTSSNRRISHSLGSAPGMILLKADESRNWYVYHRSLGRGAGAYLNLTNAAFSSSNTWGTSDPTATDFGFDEVGWATSGKTQTAYLFAHDAGGFGLTGTDNIVSCGAFTTNSSGVATVNLGYEPQWVLWKRSSGVGDWFLVDNMRGMPTTGVNGVSALRPNSPNAELTGADYTQATATGFVANSSGSSDFIYIAIRRGPMKVPTSGTSVFSPVVYSGSGSTRTLDATIVPDIYMGNTRTPADSGPVGLFVDRLRGNSKSIRTYDTSAETGTPPARDFSGQTGFTLDGNSDNVSGRTYVSWFMRRAPSFFDEVCYTGTGSTQTLTHNLGVAPEMMIVKSRSAVVNWKVYHKDLGVLYGSVDPAWQYNLTLNSTASTDFSTSRWSQDPTSTVFGVATNADTNGSGSTFVAYLFATCAGVSKVGSYTGTGATLQIDCGFTSGVRFVLIKRTNSNGGWFVWDSARGIVSGNDPYLRLESTSADVTNTDYIDSYSAGFELNASASDVNNSGDKFIFLAIA
jgi:hypothetical protein